MDPVRLELFSNRFAAIASEMGVMLQRTAMSVNVKERLDFSCGMLDGEGRLLVNAPHIPVHLGALGECVRGVAAELDLGPGDVAVTNHPGYGGSHLPDITVISPVFVDDRLLGYVANRAHHAELGGIRPGSMPPEARSLAEEGVVIAPRYLVRAGEPRWEGMEALLGGGPAPSRSVAENLADLGAAVAANRRGAAALRRLAADSGEEEVRLYMSALYARAAERMRTALEEHARGAGRQSFHARERLDDGSPIEVEVTVDRGSARIDFTGSAPVHSGNLNATPAIIRSAAIYVLRLLIGVPLQLNEGLLAPVEFEIPRGMLNPDFPADPRRCPAVVGGNVETSQRVVDTLIKALGLCACGQGTMNNTLFGDDTFGYYETVGGGAGAGPGFPGASGVHTHMTNTRITDPEVLEHRYPVRLERFALRPGSGGAGEYPGGDGLRRELRFLTPQQVSVLGQHRVERPYGADGGESGSVGRARIRRAGGGVRDLASVDQADVMPGDVLVLETPGGGGWGPAPDPARERAGDGAGRRVARRRLQ